MGARRDPDRSALAVFADELRAQRELAGLGRDELAGQLNYSPSLISMIESGHRLGHYWRAMCTRSSASESWMSSPLTSTVTLWMVPVNLNGLG
jgi:Helix-turn-helix domain